jgi:hypothetical protein
MTFRSAKRPRKRALKRTPQRVAKARTKTSEAHERALEKGYRSGLEDAIAEQIKARGLQVEYEGFRLPFIQPAMKRTYRPDFQLPNGIIIETKGRLTSEDRKKHLWVKAAHPSLDIRFVFSNSKTKIRKGSPTTYAMWCEKNGFLYADKRIPEDWFK